jgi:hypothetical protein
MGVHAVCRAGSRVLKNRQAAGDGIADVSLIEDGDRYSKACWSAGPLGGSPSSALGTELPLFFFAGRQRPQAPLGRLRRSRRHGPKRVQHFAHRQQTFRRRASAVRRNLLANALLENGVAGTNHSRDCTVMGRNSASTDGE